MGLSSYDGHSQLLKKKVRSANQQPSVGIIANWDSTTNNVPSTFQNPVRDHDDDSMVRPGGFVGDEETDEIERGAVSNLPTKSRKMVSNALFYFILNCFRVIIILLYSCRQVWSKCPNPSLLYSLSGQKKINVAAQRNGR